MVNAELEVLVELPEIVDFETLVVLVASTMLETFFTSFAVSAISNTSSPFFATVIVTSTVLEMSCTASAAV